MKTVYLPRKPIYFPITPEFLRDTLKCFFKKYVHEDGIGYQWCLETALVVHDCFPDAEIAYKNFPEFGPHYWNSLPDGKYLDFTRNQFEHDIPEDTKPAEIKSRNYTQAMEEQVKRYRKLRSFVVRCAKKAYS